MLWRHLVRLRRGVLFELGMGRGGCTGERYYIQPRNLKDGTSVENFVRSREVKYWDRALSNHIVPVVRMFVITSSSAAMVR